MRGLISRFNLEHGRFQLSQGIEKSRDSIWFYCIFDRFRIYTSDFGANFSLLIQKPISSIIINKTIIFANLRKGIQKYVPNVTVKSLDIGYLGNDRKNYSLLVEYTSVQEDKSQIQDVTFV